MKAKLFKIIRQELQLQSFKDDLYEILPRFLNEEVSGAKSQTLKPIQRDFEWKGDAFQLFINPAAVESEDGQYNHYFPGLQEAQIEAALIEMAVQNKSSSLNGEKKFAFTLNQIQNHLAKDNQVLSREEIKHSIQVLSGCAYIILSKTTKRIFRTIETLAMVEIEADVRFLAYFGDLIVEQIKKHRHH